MNNDANDFDPRITLSLIIEEAIDTAQGDLRKYTRNLTSAQIEAIIDIAPCDGDALRGALI